MKKIKELAKCDRPREKLTAKGAAALSSVEHIAVILGSGNKGCDVMALAAKVAKVVSNTNGRFSMQDLTQVEGIGSAKAAQLVAAFELARRFIAPDAVKIESAKDVLPHVQEIAVKKRNILSVFPSTAPMRLFRSVLSPWDCLIEVRFIHEKSSPMSSPTVRQP